MRNPDAAEVEKEDDGVTLNKPPQFEKKDEEDELELGYAFAPEGEEMKEDWKVLVKLELERFVDKFCETGETKPSRYLLEVNNKVLSKANEALTMLSCVSLEKKRDNTCGVKTSETQVITHCLSAVTGEEEADNNSWIIEKKRDSLNLSKDCAWGLLWVRLLRDR